MLAGGCFWGVEDILRGVPGVIDTDVGYTGGWLENPTYDDTHDSKSGHAEADPRDVRSVGAQLRRPAREMVLQAARPDDAQPPGQRHRDAVPLSNLSADAGAEGDGGARDRARRGVGQVEAADHHSIEPAATWYSAESYHQDYLRKNPGGYTCHFMRD